MQNITNLNISELQTEVQTKEPIDPTNIVGHKAIIKRSAEGVLADIEDDVLTASLNSGKPLMAQELKKYISFRALMEADDHRFQTGRTQVKCCCPFHPDRTPSFFIYETDDYAKCYGCHWHGDIFKYEMDSNHVEFKVAWKSLNAFLRQYPRNGRKAKASPKKVVASEPEFTPRQLEERKRYAQRLANETWLAEQVCTKRFERTGEKWNSNVIQKLAQDGFLGWADSLAFIYPRGTKYRQWPGREFIWECDGGSLWRGELLTGATHIYLTESETDAIALLHTGIEEEEKGAAIIAVSGASNFQAEWAGQFKNKVVTLCFDNDKAGEDGANKTGLFLKPYASEILILPLGGAK